jgi:hypothetical protein
MREHNYKLSVHRLSVRGRAAAIATGIAALVVGGVLLVLGVTLLLGLLVAGAVLGAGVLAYRRLTGRRLTPRDTSPRRHLDPALEVFPDDAPRRRIGDKPPE